MATMRARNKIRAPRRGLGSAKADDFDAYWNVLSSALTEINTKNGSTLSFEEIYRNAYKIVLMMRGEELYERVKGLEENWLRSEVQKRINESISPILLELGESTDIPHLANETIAAGERFMTAMKKAWEDHQVSMSMITDVLMYMDRIVSADRKKPSLYVASMALFRDHVLRAPVQINSSTTVISILESVILFMIKRERTGFIVDRPLIRHCVQMLEGLYETITEEESSKLYLTLFEPALLKMSAEFYQAEGRTLVETGDAALFCRIASQRIAEEQERSRFTLSIMTEPKILAVLDQELLCKNIEEVVKFKGSGVQHMLDQNQLGTLRSIYELNARIDVKKDALTKCVNKQIVELGQRINTSTFGPPPPTTSTQPPEKKGEKGKEKEKEKPINQQTVIAIQWVDDVLALKRHYDQIWEKAFLNDQGLQSSIMASFVVFINLNPRSAEFLSLFFDENLKKGIKGKTEGEVDALLDNGITLLRFIKDKDLFEEYYKKHLSRRLMTKRAASMDAERQMISKMKVEVGNQFTQRIEAMFRDMTISEDLSISYRAHIARQGDKKDRVDLDINVLTSTMWPMEVMSPSRGEKAQVQCIFPREIDNLKKSFEAFYLDKHSGRKLTWHANMGTADIRATFQRSNGKVQRYELNVSTYGMFILCLFNDLPDGGSLTYEEIEARTRIPEHDLVRNLQSLAVAPRTRILKKEPMSKDVKPTDKFFFNHEFQSPFVKVRVGVVSGGANKVEDQDQRKETERKMNDERGGSIEAAVVRIMKQRKTLTHAQLMTEVLSQVSSRFSPDVNMIKRRFESLIDREYMERVSDDPPTYGYVA